MDSDPFDVRMNFLPINYLIENNNKILTMFNKDDN